MLWNRINSIGLTALLLAFSISLDREQINAMPEIARMGLNICVLISGCCALIGCLLTLFVRSKWWDSDHLKKDPFLPM